MAFAPLERNHETRYPKTAEEDVKLRFDGWRPIPEKTETDGEKPADKPAGRAK